MKQRLYQIALLLTASLLIVSCTDTKIIPDDNPDGPGGIGDNCSFQLLLPHLQPMTKAYDWEKIGSEGENLIDGIRVVLYGASQTVNYTFDLDIKTSYSGTTLTASGNDMLNYKYVDNTLVIQTRARSAQQGEYKMLIIANPTAAILTATQSGKSIDEVNSFDTTAENSMYRIVEGVNGVTAGDAAYFLMLNAQGLIDVKESNFYESREQAQEHPITDCAIERVTAKVTCAFNSGYTVTSNKNNIGRFAMRLDSNSGTDWGTDYDIPDSQTTCPICGGTFNRVTKICPSCQYEYGNGEGLGATVSAVRYMVATDFT